MPVNEAGFGRVSAGVWTGIYSGPAFHVPAVFSVNFRTVPRGTRAFFVTFTWDLYSAVLPSTTPGRASSRRRSLRRTSSRPRSELAAYTSTPWADVLILVSREAAAALFPSPKTIEFHLAHIYRKLGVRTRTQLAALAARRGWLAEAAAAANQD
jgi:hypothetical protein